MINMKTKGATRRALTVRTCAVAALGISLLAFAPPASAQRQDERYGGDAETQYRYRDTSQSDLDTANRRLSDIYQSRIAEARAADRRHRNVRNWYSQETALRNSERYWISFRAADCRYIAQPYVGQRQYDGYLRGCLVDRTNERISELRQSRLSVDGDDQRDERWRRRYARSYDYNDDAFYQQCRNGPDPAAVIAGGLIGGLVGNAAGRDGSSTGSTIAGVILGAAIGAALTNDVDCADRSYAYRAYYDGLTSGRPNSDYDWRNQRSGNFGRFHVDQYYEDQDGFRCVTYRQSATISRRSRETQGHACQQPNGVWVVVD